MVGVEEMGGSSCDATGWPLEQAIGGKREACENSQHLSAIYNCPDLIGAAMLSTSPPTAQNCERRTQKIKLVSGARAVEPFAENKGVEVQGC